ncbi:hypothetical protein CR203_11820 [Salipaludibacillus neizhouensis]|uniref:Spo0E family sporulation regulatory protein-aspartic acid phosphatase n=1 Tax=Salipaludibacillus neizhouensis TaxID=885475 RepID=A0A3A9K8N9_9BACI|nr:aspartyl-phosphate phosphatase Spo0E family protein [Salipaludibacillus neizhouensis]RKL67190.1 hypothetical protein CR203_11820 [Salipaludibacillus neizhouensis]
MDNPKNDQLKRDIEEMRIDLETQLKRRKFSNLKIIEISQNLDDLIAEYMIKTNKTK